MEVPFQNYSIINKKLKKELLKEINLVLNLVDNSSHNEYIEKFEEFFGNYFGVKFALGVDSGTTALQLALIASGIKPGDEIILPCYTYIATALAISNIGAKPVFVDIKEDLTINPLLIEKAITDKTKAIIPVHIHGNLCDLASIFSICQKYNLKLIEDASQAHGAEYDGKKIGCLGIGCFSMHTSKTLGGVGDAGIILLNDERIYKKMKKLISLENNTQELLFSKRTPCKIDAIQAAIIKVKLNYLSQFNKRKHEIAKLYNMFLNCCKVKKMELIKNSYAVYRDYCIRVDTPEKLKKFLDVFGIKTKTGYVPLHLIETFDYLGYNKGDFPVSEELSKQILCLPCFIGLNDKQIEHVCDKINEFH
ncbi:MAG: DegT/DnrJ/EryC1/StrS family aminotransferase [Nanoarchaeota archaeon]|nr:DegT/DnrJ/EryC1/StrS family aminotransferase [Nanoarchaeota archaeon]